jgi:hypothetical protein
VNIAAILRHSPWAALLLAVAALVVTVWLLIRPTPVPPPPNDMAGRIAATVDSAGVVCLSDLNETKTKNVRTGISVALQNIGGSGTVSEKQVRSSVNLAIDQNLLLQEREKVRSCMEKTVYTYLEVQGLINKTDSNNLPHTTAIDVNALQSELEEVKHNIDVWNDAIFKNEGDIKLEKAKADQYRSANRPFMADASDKTVALLTDTLSTQKEELGKSTARRKQIEDLLAKSSHP